MKRLLQLIWPLLLLSCSTEPTGTENPTTDEVAMGFTATLSETNSATSRAPEDFRGWGEHNNDSLKLKGFGVYCWNTGAKSYDPESADPTLNDIRKATQYLLMRNQKVEWTGSAWDYSPSKYWPLISSHKLTLRAYAPYVDYQLPVDANGFPQLPVVVYADDYCNNTQKDPLWGTSRHSSYISDDANTNGRYGALYNNYTYVMSGNDLTADERDGIIDWYFHHGMTKLGLQAILEEPKPHTEVRITKVETGPYYNEGLLNIFTSPSERSSEKPVWSDRAGDIWVTIAYHHDPDGTGTKIHDDLTGAVLNGSSYTNIAVNGLLAIPRDYTGETKLTIRVTYEETDTSTGITGLPVTVEATVDLDAKGNTVYALQMLLGAESLSIRSFVNIDWQSGSYGLIDGL